MTPDASEMSALLLKSLTMYGMVIVISLCVAALIKLIVVLLAASEARSGRRTAAQRPQQSLHSQHAQHSQQGLTAADIDPAHVAAIAAAVEVMTHGGRIVHIADAHHESAWSHEGKWLQQTSHDVHRKGR